MDGKHITTANTASLIYAAFTLNQAYYTWTSYRLFTGFSVTVILLHFVFLYNNLQCLRLTPFKIFIWCGNIKTCSWMLKQVPLCTDAQYNSLAPGRLILYQSIHWESVGMPCSCVGTTTKLRENPYQYYNPVLVLQVTQESVSCIPSHKYCV